MKILPGFTIKIADPASRMLRSCPWRPDGRTARSPERVLAACSRWTRDFLAPGAQSLMRVVRPHRAAGVASATKRGVRRVCHGESARKDLPLHKAVKRREAMRQHRLSRTPDSQS
jgi:hypothetical protein